MDCHVFALNLHFNTIMSRVVKVSVLMAVYNTDFSITKRAIDSVLCQDYQDFELIISDNAEAKGILHAKKNSIPYLIINTKRRNYEYKILKKDEARRLKLEKQENERLEKIELENKLKSLSRCILVDL